MKSNEINKEQIIKDGKLICNLSKDNNGLTHDYESEFTFENNQLKSLNYIISIVGDENKLVSYNEKCKLLGEITEYIPGASVSCKLKDDEFMESQVINYNLIDLNTVTSSYIEAGGIFFNFSENDNIKDIQYNMEQTGFRCKSK